MTVPADVEATGVAAASRSASADAVRPGTAEAPAEPVLRGPVAPASRAREPRRLRARKVHRVVRHVEPWSVLKISLIFYFCIWLIMLVAGTVLWRVAAQAGLIDNIENFIKDIFALESFTFEAGQIFRAYALGGLVVVVAATGFTVLLAVLFNLISDLTGGIRVTVIEEETARPLDPSPSLSPSLRHRLEPGPAPSGPLQVAPPAERR